MCKGIKTEHKEEEENANDRQKEVGENGRCLGSDKMALWGHVTTVEKDMKEFLQTYLVCVSKDYRGLC